MHEQLTDRSIIRITGSDRVKFIQNFTTNDVEKNQFSYNYILNNQGRYLFDFFVHKAQDQLFLDVPAMQLESLTKRLNMFKLRADATIEDVSNDYAVFYVKGESEIEQEAVYSMQDPRDQRLGKRVVILKEILKQVQDDTLGIHDNTTEASHNATGASHNTTGASHNTTGASHNTTGASHNSTGAQSHHPERSPCHPELVSGSPSTNLYLADKYEYGIVDGYLDLESEKSIPIEFAGEEQNAISFDKGCYVGQEVISRAKHQGVIRKTVYLINLEVEVTKIEKGGEVLSESGDKIGKICSTFQNRALALLRKEKVEALGEEKKVRVASYQGVVL